MSQECEVSWYIGSEGVYQNLGGRKLVRGLARLPRYDWVSSQKGGNYVTTGWCRDWSEAVVVLAGQEGKGEPARGRSPRRGEEVEPTLTCFVLNS